MLAQPNAPQSLPVAVTPAVAPRTKWRVTAVEALPAYRLRVRFVDGIEGFVDIDALIHSAGAGVFAALADQELFSRATVVHGAVTWPGEIDLAPDAMHAAITARGEWILGEK
jgi:hypothetical protein